MVAKKEATIIGIDATPGLLEVTRKRKPGINFLEYPEALPFAHDSFDIVAGLNFFQYAVNLKMH